MYSTANSVASLQCGGSEDGDTLGSRHSSSSGQHSGTSEQPSSHSFRSGHSSSPTGHYQQQLHVQTDQHNSSRLSVQHSPRPDFYLGEEEEMPSNRNGGRGSTSGSRSLMMTSSPERRPLLQTFHPKKHASSSHERFHANTLDGVSHRGEGEERRLVLPQRRAVSRDAVTVTEGVGDEDDTFINEQGFRPRTHSDSCDKRVGRLNQYHLASLDCSDSQGHCSGCGGYRPRVGEHSKGDFKEEKSVGSLSHEIQEGEGCVSCSQSNNCASSHPKHSYNGDSSSRTNCNNSEGRPLPSTPPISSPQSSASASRHHHHHQQHQRGPALHTGRPQHAKGCVHNKSNGNKLHKKQHNASGPDVAYSCELSGASNGRPLSPPCCCEVMRDSKYCTTCSSVQRRGEEEEEEQMYSHCRHHDQRGSNHPQCQHSSMSPLRVHCQHGGGRGANSQLSQHSRGRSVSPGNSGHDPGYSGNILVTENCFYLDMFQSVFIHSKLIDP